MLLPLFGDGAPRSGSMPPNTEISRSGADGGVGQKRQRMSPFLAQNQMLLSGHEKVEMQATWRARLVNGPKPHLVGLCFVDKVNVPRTYQISEKRCICLSIYPQGPSLKKTQPNTILQVGQGKFTILTGPKTLTISRRGTNNMTSVR